MNKILLAFYALFLFSCISESRKMKIVSQTDKRVYLKGESLQLADSLGNPSCIYCFDSLLFMNENQDDYKMVICDPFKRSVVNKLIPKGRGPGEQIGTFFFTYSGYTRKIYAFDITLRKILELDRDSVSIASYKPVIAYNMPALNIFQGTMLDDSTFAVSGNSHDFRAATFTLEGLIEKSGDSPDSRSDMSTIINEAYMGAMAAAPNGNKFVISCRYADQLEIFTLGEKQQLFVKGPKMFEPCYSVKEMGNYKLLAHSKDEIYGYTDVCVTDEYIYALYAGKTRERGGMYCNVVRVFSWNGEYLADYVLDRKILSFTVDKQGLYFYGIVSEPGAEVYRFKLSDI